MRFSAVWSILMFFSLSHHASSAEAEQPLCVHPIGSKFEYIDLKVLKSPDVKAKKQMKIFIQKGKYIYNENEVQKGEKDSYCEIDYFINYYEPYSKTWKANAVHHTRLHTMPGGPGDPPKLSISPNPKEPRPYVSYDCPNLKTYEDLQNELKPLIDVPCIDWGTLLPKNGKPGPVKCDK